MQPRVLILRAPGTTCDGETAYAFQRAGGRAEVVHVRRILESPGLISDFQIFCIPGGFSYGDDIASGRILALQLKQRLAGALREFQPAGKLILGICNGFQALLRCGLLAVDREQSTCGHADVECFRQVRCALGATNCNRRQVRVSGRHRADVFAGGACRREIRRQGRCHAGRT